MLLLAEEAGEDAAVALGRATGTGGALSHGREEFLALLFEFSGRREVFEVSGNKLRADARLQDGEHLDRARDVLDDGDDRVARPDGAGGFGGQAVHLRGTLIYRGNQTMIEVIAESIKAVENPKQDLTKAASIQQVDLGRQTLIGEIVDSKCYLGVMDPGQLTTHRACAIRCISGGCPPVLLVRQTNSPPLYLLLVSSDGHPVNKHVLDRVAEPLEITGDIVRQG